jgi:nitrogen fixation-related uncharacterized protein
MLEIHRRYVLDDAGEPIAVQISIAQFESLLGLVPQRDQVMVTDDDDLGLADAVLQQAVAVGLEAVENGEYDDYDEAGLEALFDRVKQNGRSRRGIQA